MKLHGVIAQFNSVDVNACISSLPLYLQRVIQNNYEVYRYIKKCIPKNLDHPMLCLTCFRPYMYQYTQKTDIEKMVQEMLNICITHPRQRRISTLVVIV